MICERGAIVIVPFPLSDLPVAKPRPALVLSPWEMNGQMGQTLLAMITTAARPRWPHDVEIGDIVAAGLPGPCLIRWKLFPLYNQLIARQIGKLSPADREAVAVAARAVVAL